VGQFSVVITSQSPLFIKNHKLQVFALSPGQALGKTHRLRLAQNPGKNILTFFLL
jgi:hypothetical protein